MTPKRFFSNIFYGVVRKNNSGILHKGLLEDKMKRFKNSVFRMLSCLMIAVFISTSVVVPEKAYAAGVDLHHIEADWVSGLRQPASGGMFAWYAVTFDEDYWYGDKVLYNDLKASDFMLQVKPQGGTWTDVPGKNLTVLTGTDAAALCASFEAIIAALVPANEDDIYKQWRIVYLPGNIASEAITQSAKLKTADHITVSDFWKCEYAEVGQLPWSREQYEQDSIPPIYTAYINPNIQLQIIDQSPDTAGRKIVPLWTYGASDFGEGGRRYSSEDQLPGMTAGLGLEDIDEEDDHYVPGIRSVVDYWNDMVDWGMMSADIPEAEDLYNKLASVALNPEDPSATESAAVFWVSNAGEEERIDPDVSDYLLVIVFEENKYGTEKHNWGEPSWEWTGDDENGYTGAAASFVCSAEGRSDHKKTVKAEVTAEIGEGSLIFTAVAELDGKEYIDTKTVANPSDKTELKTAIDAATADRDSVTVSDEPDSLPDGTEYVSTEAAKALEQAIADAQTVFIKPGASQSEVDDAAAALNAAVETFDKSKQQKKNKAESKPIYRLYNKKTKEHLWTASKNEYNALPKYGWTQEGKAWSAPASGKAVYRLYNPKTKDHHYTAAANEVKVLSTKYGWKKDNNGKPVFYSGGSKPIYRLYNKSFKVGAHHLTTSANEYKTLAKYGWKQEGIALYAVK